ncbi:MaoC family dehydratase [Halocatena salina]|uniref:MaoC family dehydratase n=1 Tax=Halocatena salina TaxID=2934340 RepID=A0A8T9ZZ73_9EURY|nr:MaoC family dehydratase [Halocatena salina]UPM42070.1 MaoC family dehydratase [Halocatena salina]
MLSGYYEDIEIGTTREFGSYTVEKEEIVSFAEQYDPQPFHVDESAAEESIFGELVASGWHTAAMTMRMLVDNSPDDSRAMGAVGVDELRWNEPVRPGDTLSVRTEVMDKEPWDDDLGLIRSRTTVFAGDTEVMGMTGRVLYQRRVE